MMFFENAIIFCRLAMLQRASSLKITNGVLYFCDTFFSLFGLNISISKVEYLQNEFELKQKEEESNGRFDIPFIVKLVEQKNYSFIL